MDRELLFRGKRVDNGEWVEGYYVGDVERDKYYIYSPQHTGIYIEIRAIKVHKETVGQFTGLLDKNGKKIFEGDVLRYEPQHTKYENTYFENVVEFASGQSLVGWRMRNGRCVVRATPFKFKMSEIIGNIHDNQELHGKGASNV